MSAPQLSRLIEVDRLLKKLEMEMIRFRRAESDGAEVREILGLLDTLELLAAELYAYGSAADGPMRSPLKGVDL